MTAKLKVMTVVGTRPEIIRLSRVISRFDDHFDHTLVHTGQNTGTLSEPFFRELQVRAPDFYLDVAVGSTGQTIAQTIEKTEVLLRGDRPDALLVLGDTNSAYAALIARRMGITVYHMEAGNRSFDENVPEELNRRVIDHLANFNMPYNHHSYRNLMREGLNPRFVCLTGSPLLEVIRHHRDSIVSSQILKSLNLDPSSFIVASFHRQENVDNPTRLEEMLHSLQEVGESLNVRVIISTHPRTKSKLAARDLGHLSRLEFHSPFSFFDYMKLQSESLLVISDSGTVSEESHMLGFSAISFRDSIERQEALDSGLTILSGVDRVSVRDSVNACLSFSQGPRNIPSGYDVPNTSEIVTKFVLSTARKAHDWFGIRQ